MGRIEDTFIRLQAEGKKVLIPYIMAGDPDLDTTRTLVCAIARAGGDLLELGVPFSDPIADGPTIQRASERSLRSGTTLRKVLKLVRDIRRDGIEIPIIIMTYYNIIFRYGIEKLAKDAVSSGVDGLIVPDLPPEEATDLLRASASSGLDLIFLLAPTSTEDRIKLIGGISKGFLYYVSMTGITGAKLKSIAEIQEKIPLIKRHTDLPVIVGFGISNKKEAKKVSKLADGVVIGSAIVRIIESTRKKLIPQKVAGFIKSIKMSIG